MASIPKAADANPARKWRVTITGRRGKSPPKVSMEIEAATAKEAQRAVMRAILTGLPVVELVDPEPQSRARRTLGLAS